MRVHSILAMVIVAPLSVASLAAPEARAQTPAVTPAEAPAPASSPAPASRPEGEPGFLTNLWTRSTLLGDAGGLRTKLRRL